MRNKKGLVVFIAVLFHVLCKTGTLNAAPSFGTVMPESGKWIAGGEFNHTFERDVRDYKNVKSSQCFYNLSYGFSDWFSFDAKLGIGDFSAKTTGKDDYDSYKANFAGGYGWRARLFKDPGTGLAGIWGFEHMSVHPSRKEIDSVKHDAIWDNWQIHVTTYRKFGNIYPYCGMKGSVLYIIRRISGNRTRRRSGDYMGLIVGTDLAVNDYIYVNVEGRFLDETALSTAFTVKY